MDVINDNAALLSNYEVFSVLRSRYHKRQLESEACKQLATISYETLRYLEKTPCRFQSPEVLENFGRAVEPFKLMKAERLQLLNLRPTADVVVYLLVEEIDTRLNLDELLNVVTACLPDGNDGAGGVETSDVGASCDDG